MGFSGPCVVDRDAYESSPNKRYYQTRHFSSSLMIFLENFSLNIVNATVRLLDI